MTDRATPTIVATVEEHRPANRMNDGKVGPDGCFWAGTMSVDLRPGAGALYRLDHDHSVRTVLDSVSISNGLDWSLDGRTLYFIDSLAGGVDQFDFDPETGAISRRRRLIDIPAALGLPDGMTVDADGCLWVAVWGGSCARRYTPDGALVAVVELPVGNVTSCAFGGASLDVLYITTARASLTPTELDAQPFAGGLFACRPGVIGQPPRLFLG